MILKNENYTSGFSCLQSIYTSKIINQRKNEAFQLIRMITLPSTCLHSIMLRLTFSPASEIPASLYYAAAVSQWTSPDNRDKVRHNRATHPGNVLNDIKRTKRGTSNLLLMTQYRWLFLTGRAKLLFENSLRFVRNASYVLYGRHAGRLKGPLGGDWKCDV